jgi:hypothetical protein
MKSLEDMVEAIKKYKKFIKYITIYLREPTNNFKYYHHDIDIWFTEQVMVDGELRWGLIEHGFGCKESNAKQIVENFVEKLRVIGFDFLDSTKSYGLCTLIKPGDIESIDLDDKGIPTIILNPGRCKINIHWGLDLFKQSLENHERYDLLLQMA